MLEKAGCPTACEKSGEQFSAGTNGSLTARTGELAAPTNRVVVATTASILLALLNATSSRSLFRLQPKGVIRIVGRDGLMQSRPEPRRGRRRDEDAGAKIGAALAGREGERGDGADSVEGFAPETQRVHAREVVGRQDLARRVPPDSPLRIFGGHPGAVVANSYQGHTATFYVYLHARGSGV